MGVADLIHKHHQLQTWLEQIITGIHAHAISFMKQIGSKLEIVQLALHAAADRIAIINALEATHADAQSKANEEQIRQEKESLKKDIINIINGLSLIEKSIK